MKSKKLFILFLGLFIIPTLVLSGICVPKSYAEEEYIFLAVVSSVPYWADSRQGIADAGKVLGVKTTFMGPPDFDVAKEAQMLNDLIAKKPAGIIIYPGDTSLTESINRVVEAGIPVITDNNDCPESKRMTHTGFDGYEAGRAGAELMAEALGGKGKVIIGGFPSPNVMERQRGYKEVFKEKYPEIEVVAVVNDHADPTKAPQVYTQAIIAHPEATGIIGTDGDSGKGIALALVETGKVGKIKVVAMDRNEDMLPYIEDGTIYASIADKAYMNAFLGIHMLYWYHHNIVQPIPNWKKLGIRVFPEFVKTGVMAITKESVKNFYHKKR